MQAQLRTHLTDGADNFYFMINPYFPTPEMVGQVGGNLAHLIRYYPSDQKTIAGKIRKIEGISRPLIAANGSCEAIRILLRRHRGRKLVLVPNFNEWEIADHVPIPFDAPTAQIAAAIEEKGIDLVCICNPNNPTGFFRRDIQALAQGYPKVQFAVDISFIDFADEIIPELPRGKNVILVKSLGKNYGMCGLRLGYIACEDPAVLDGMRREFPIWNINSVTECLLDLIADHLRDYEASRVRIIRGTGRMRSLLEAMPSVEVFPGQANFVMIRTRETLGFNVKNCGNKTGLDPSYYRVAYNTNYRRLLELIPGPGQGG